MRWSGAATGPNADLDLRTLTCWDLTFRGSTILRPDVMQLLIAYIETSKIAPKLAATYPLRNLHAAQAASPEKRDTGNRVIVP